jgi:hypothetical protein
MDEIRVVDETWRDEEDEDDTSSSCTSGTDTEEDEEEEVANISANAAAAQGDYEVGTPGRASRPSEGLTPIDNLVALADQAALGAIEARRLSKTPVKGGGVRPKTATGVESSPSKRVGNGQSAFEPVGLRPVSTGPGYKSRQSELFPSLGTLRRFELGNPDPPPLGTRTSRGAAARSVASNLDNTFVFGGQDFEDNDWTTPSLNLVGNNYASQVDLRRRVLEEQRRQNTEDNIDQAIQLSRVMLDMKRREQELKAEKEELAARKEAVNNLVATAEKQLREGTRLMPAAAADKEKSSQPPVTVSLEGVRKDLKAQEKRVRKAQKSYDKAAAGSSSSSTVGGDTLVAPFVNLTKVVNRLNDPEARNDPAVLERNLRKLQTVTAEAVERGLSNSLHPYSKLHDERTAQLIGVMIGRSEAKTLGIIEEEVLPMIKRIETNEKLASRANTEKIDEVRVLPFYPPEPGASGEIYRKALAHSNNTVRVIERTVLFNQDPFNFVMRLCRESNKIAADFQLSKKQQWALIFEHIPVGDDYAYLQRTRNLEDLFLTVSTMATHIVTRPNLEKQINEWKLVNKSETEMYQSITRLFNLLDKIRPDFGTNEADPVELFRQAVALIARQDGLPRYIQEALELARLRVKDSDSTGEMTQVLLSACQRYVGQRPSRNQVKAIEYVPDGFAAAAATVHQVQLPILMPPQQAPHPQPQQQQQSGGKKNYNNRGRSQNRKNQGQNQQGQNNQQQKQNQPQQQDGKKNVQQKGRGQSINRGRPRFVRPWPENTPYLSKNGNTLSGDFNKWFDGFCFKCGFSKHAATDCKIYTEKHTVITLCSHCRQGLHDVCRSKRRDLVQAAAIKEGVEKGVKAIVSKMTMVPPPQSQPMYWPYALLPPQPSTQAVQQEESDSE